MAERPGLIAWLSAGQEPHLRDLLERAAVDLVAVTAPHPQEATALARAFAVDALPDLRAALQHERADVLWLAAPVDHLEREQRPLRPREPALLAAEPFPRSVGETIVAPDSRIEVAPLLRWAPGHVAAAEVVSQLEGPFAVSVQLVSGPGEGTLLGRLFDGLDLIESCCGPVERVDGAAWGPRGDHRHVTANLRFGDGRGAALTVSHGAGSWFREATLLGDESCLRIWDDGFALSRRGRPTERLGGRGAPVRYGHLVAHQMSRRLERRPPQAPPADTTRLLALCEAVWLSARTGQGESPRRLLELLSRP
jgi:predicted dehydrogenase